MQGEENVVLLMERETPYPTNIQTLYPDHMPCHYKGETE
jgi:hypothetical protein